MNEEQRTLLLYQYEDKSQEKQWRVENDHFRRAGNVWGGSDAGGNVLFVLPFCTIWLFTPDEQWLGWKCKSILSKHVNTWTCIPASQTRELCVEPETRWPHKTTFLIEPSFGLMSLANTESFLREGSLIMVTASIVRGCQGDCSLITQGPLYEAPKRNAWMVFILRLLGHFWLIRLFVSVCAVWLNGSPSQEA